METGYLFLGSLAALFLVWVYQELTSLRRDIAALRDYVRSRFPGDFPPAAVPSALRPPCPESKNRTRSVFRFAARLIYPILPFLWLKLPSPLFRAAALLYLEVFGPLAQQEADRRAEAAAAKEAAEKAAAAPKVLVANGQILCRYCRVPLQQLEAAEGLVCPACLAGFSQLAREAAAKAADSYGRRLVRRAAPPKE